MAFSKEEAVSALEYIKQLKIVADVDPRDGKTILFKWIPDLPDQFSEDVRSTLEICIEYHQRSVFTGEYLKLDDHPPIISAGSALEEINFFLEHYKPLMIIEVEKGLDLHQPLETDKRPKRKATPYAKAMLKYRAKQRKTENEPPISD
ncbi:hypothetical protein KKI24_27495 [bacterium]|nr:hypothetical protein [bacterium]